VEAPRTWFLLKGSIAAVDALTESLQLLAYLKNAAAPTAKRHKECARHGLRMKGSTVYGQARKAPCSGTTMSIFMPPRNKLNGIALSVDKKESSYRKFLL
jgi:hypothetical protein